jgi:alpha-D-ribose 1-methylphosphonate 5-triphosphate synthase subunit PhnL
MTLPIVRLRGASKRIRLHILGQRIVEPFRDVSFDAYPGELVAIVGASGSGKSSVVKAIHRTYLTTEGAIFYRCGDGTAVDLARLPDPELVALRRREIGYVSQFLRAEPRTPALDVVAMPLLRRGVEREDAYARARALLEELSVPRDLWSSYPTLFSGGEQQRIGIARALIGQPRLLLADEPTSALDGRNVARAIEAIGRAVRDGTTVVGVFHDVGLVRRLADRVVLMEDGRVTQQGRPDEVAIPAGESLQELAPRI